MATEKRLIYAKGKFTLNAGDITGHIMCFENGYATVFDRFAKVVCKFSLLDAPTVDAVEVVHGRWKNVKETEVYSPEHRCTFTHTAQTCSVCNVRIGFIGAKFYLYDGYCPNCGADMRDGDGNG